MIQILEKNKCCGCEACIQRCPKSCISLSEDNEGFLYPKVDTNLCVNCGICHKVCPIENQGNVRNPLISYASFNLDDETRMNSSSGGLFSLFAEYVIKELKGVVFGAKYNNNWEVVHSYIEKVDEIKTMQQSKYMQSHIGNTFIQTEKFLKEGRYVLFTGTPCQISALRLFLQKDYEKLITVDFICHGVPSPGIFRWYLNEEIQKNADLQQEDKKLNLPISMIPSKELINEWKTVKILNILFRNKKDSWKNYKFTLSMKINSDQGEHITKIDCIWNKNPYMRGFIWNLYDRPCCHNCPSKELKSGSDITIGDLWGASKIVPEMDDDKGLNAVCINTEKGVSFFSKIDNKKIEINYKDIRENNVHIYKSATKHHNRNRFWKNIPLKKGNISKHIVLNLMSRKQLFRFYIKEILIKLKLRK